MWKDLNKLTVYKSQQRVKGRQKKSKKHFLTQKNKNKKTSRLLADPNVFG